VLLFGIADEHAVVAGGDDEPLALGDHAPHFHIGG
jgi:hypothetical protein